MAKIQKKKKIYPAAIAAAVFVLVLFSLRAGLLIFLAFFPLVIWMIFNIINAIRRPETRKVHLARLSIWVIAIVVILGAEYARYVAVHKYANDIATTIKRFSVIHGRYPKDLTEIGIDHQKMQEELGWSGYFYMKGNPVLFYFPDFSFFRPRYYDFERGVWTHSN